MFNYSLNILLSILIVSMLDGASQDKSFEVPDFGGETMQYKLKYGMFNIGVATISCLEDPAGCGCTIRAVAQSSGLMKIIKNLIILFKLKKQR